MCLSFDEGRGRLTALSSCCGNILLSKIGTEILVCSKCDTEYQLIPMNKIEKGLSNCRINMEKVKTKTEKEYWCGFIGGIRWSLQKENKK